MLLLGGGARPPHGQCKPVADPVYGVIMSIPFDLWGQRGYAGIEVVGESRYETPIRNLLGRDLKEDGKEIQARAELVPEPHNRHDRNAIGVWVGGGQVGYLGREDAVRYARVLSRLVESGWSPQVTARVWGAEWDDYDDRKKVFRGSVRLDLGEPHMLVPANMPPSGEHRLLPVGGAIQVTGEERHLDTLAPWLRPEGECWVHVTLHEVVEHLARTSREVIEVRIEGERIGQLTPKMSGDLLPAVRHVAEQNCLTAARAIVKGNRIKTEVVLYVARAHELPESWLSDVKPSAPRAAAVAVPEAVVPVQQDHRPIPPYPTGIRFVVPPEWPQPPPGWIPDEGWRPDPTWPEAPEDWQWWIPVWE